MNKISVKKQEDVKKLPNTIYVGLGSKYGNNRITYRDFERDGYTVEGTNNKLYKTIKEALDVSLKMYIEKTDVSKFVKDLKGKDLAYLSTQSENMYVDYLLQEVNSDNNQSK